ncbi:hypothetical protein HZA97_09755 [Candidatus Woesearchaeota archaeon]|nr:hypothetical protein [Candidatus Woesearchaeota archaeon]
MKSQVIIKELEKENLYLLLKVGIDSNEKIVLVSLPCEHHIDILENYTSGLKRREAKYVNVVGGGIFILEEENKKIIHYANASKQFKHLNCPSEPVEELLKQKYPGYSIETILE